MESSDNTEGKSVPFTFVIDEERFKKLKAAKRSTRISMSDIMRLSLDNFFEILEDPENPSPEGLAKILSMR
jgi:hypothetical protein